MNASKHTILSALKLIYLCSPALFCLEVLCTLVQSVLPIVNLYVLKLLVDAATAQTFVPQDCLVLVGVFGGVYLLGRLIGCLNSFNMDVLSQKLIDFINEKIQNKSMELDLAFFDTPAFYDKLHRAQIESSLRPIQILEASMNLVGALVSLVGVLAMLLSCSLWIIIIMVVSLCPSLAVRLYKAYSVYKFRRENTKNERKSRYYSAVLTDELFSKEVRAYRLGEKFRAKYVAIRRQIAEAVIRISKKNESLDALGSVFETVALVCVTIFLINGVAKGSSTIGDFVMLFEAFRRGMSYLQTAISNIAKLYNNKLFISNLFEFLSLEGRILPPSAPVEFPERVESVEFDHIAFSYPGASKPVFTDYSLKAERGKVTHIEGQNGFGKTTLLKLLLRLYDPQGGCIRINGIDIREFDPAELRRNVCAVFQDFVRYYLTVEENIALGNVNEELDESRMKEAARLSGLEAVVDKLPKGYKTPLGRFLEDDGVELSMGQKQRLAIARQLYSRAQVLAFDEPLAWMDAVARGEFASELSELAKDKVVILISHLRESPECEAR